MLLFSKKLAYPIIPFNINELVTTVKGSKHNYNIYTTDPTSKSKMERKVKYNRWKVDKNLQISLSETYKYNITMVPNYDKS